MHGGLFYGRLKSAHTNRVLLHPLQIMIAVFHINRQEPQAAAIDGKHLVRGAGTHSYAQ